MMENQALVVKNLKKVFKIPALVEVLSNVSFSLAAGESIAIMGPSGTGKSTLLNILGALEDASEGEILFGGKPLTSFSIPFFRQNIVGFVFQSFQLLEDDSALDNILLPAHIARNSIRPKSKSYERAIELLDRVGLETRKDFPVKLLSGGEKQRIGIARALMNNPSIILADEPTGNLDKKNSQILGELLIGCCKEYQKSMILVTHDRSLADLCDRTLVLQDGTLQ